MAADALASLYGRTADLGEREQTALTGQPIADLLSAFWGPNGMDPCAAPLGPLWVPCMFCKGTGVKKGKTCRSCDGVGGCLQESSIRAEIEVRLPMDGLALPWVDKTFCNPPYKKLEPWLLHPFLLGRTIWYVPVRPNRKWWRKWARSCSVVVALNPQSFKGHKAMFPSALCLGFQGPKLEAVRLAQMCEKLELGEAL